MIHYKQHRNQLVVSTRTQYRTKLDNFSAFIQSIENDLTPLPLVDKESVLIINSFGDQIYIADTEETEDDCLEDLDEGTYGTPSIYILSDYDKWRRTHQTKFYIDSTISDDDNFGLTNILRETLSKK